MNTRVQKTKSGPSATSSHQQPRRPAAESTSGQRNGQSAIADSPYIVAQRKTLTRCFGADTVAPIQKQDNQTGMPDSVKTHMETRFNTNFSDVRIHANSSQAPAVGALAYAQGNHIHFAPGQFKPESSSGKGLLGHELTHVVQQRQGRVRPTTEVGGLPVNDSPQLEKEADAFGQKAAR